MRKSRFLPHANGTDLHKTYDSAGKSGLHSFTLSPIQTNTDANSAAPDEKAHDEPTHQDLHYIPFFTDF